MIKTIFFIYLIYFCNAETHFISEIRLFIKDVSVNDGWLPCDGSCYDRSLFVNLFNVINCTYGCQVPNLFCVPNLNNRTVLISKFGNTIGEQIGENEHNLTISELPSHSHSLNLCSVAGDTDDPSDSTLVGDSEFFSDSTDSDSTVMVGNSSSINYKPMNLQQPFVRLKYYISHNGIEVCACNILSRFLSEYIMLASPDTSEKPCFDAIGKDYSVLIGISDICDTECGSDTIALNIDNLPSHDHQLLATTDNANMDTPEGSIFAQSSSDVIYNSNASCTDIKVKNHLGPKGTNTEISNKMDSITMSLVKQNSSLNNCLESNIAPLLGEIRIFDNPLSEPGWVLCDGNIITEYDPQFISIIQSTPALQNSINYITPNMTYSIPVGTNDVSTIGTTGGSVEYTLNKDNIPPHSHSIPVSTSTGTGSGIYFAAMSENIYSNIAPNTVFSIHTISFDTAPTKLLPYNSIQVSKAAYYYMYVGIPISVTPQSSLSATPTTSISLSNAISQSSTISNSVSPSSTMSNSISESNSKTTSKSFSTSKTKSKSISNSISMSTTPSISLSSSSSISLSSSTSVTPSISISKYYYYNINIAAPIPINETTNSPSNSVRDDTTNFITHSPTSSLNTCFTCQNGNENIVIETPIERQDTTIDFTNPNGEIIGSISNIPEGNILIIEFVPDEAYEVESFSPFVNIDVYNTRGEPITQFEDPLTICLESTIPKNDVCLNYYDIVLEQWFCEDACLKNGNNNQVCGETNHLTNFALLLDIDGNDNGCGSSESIPVLFWISLGLCGLSVIIILIAILLIHIKYYLKKKKLASEFRVMESAMSGS